MTGEFSPFSSGKFIEKKRLGRYQLFSHANLPPVKSYAGASVSKVRGTQDYSSRFMITSDAHVLHKAGQSDSGEVTAFFA